MRLSFTYTVFAMAVSFILGILVRAFFSIHFDILFFGLLLSFLLTCFCINHSKYFFTSLFIFCVLAGALRYDLSLPNTDDPSFITSQIGEYHEVQGIVKQDVKKGSSTYQTIIESERGDLLVYTRARPGLFRHDQVSVNCEIQEPTVFAGFNYKAYLMHRNVYATCLADEITLLKEGSGFVHTVSTIRKQLADQFSLVFSFSYAAYAKGLVLADSSDISNERSEQISAVGLSHVFAISGLHMSLWAFLFLFLCQMIGISKKQAFLPVTALLFLYVLLIGFPESAVRASIMASLLLLSYALGKKYHVILALACSALIMLLINPHAVFYVGFQLSFLAVLGIIYFFSLFEVGLKKVHVPEVLQLRSILAVTLAVTFMIWPITTYYFGTFTVLAFVANVLVLPVLPILLISLALGLLLSFVSHTLASIVWYTADRLFAYMNGVMDLLSSFSFGIFNVSVSLWMVLAWYVFVGIIVFSVNEKS